MGSDLMEQDDDEQDLLKETFLETSPILLGLTVIVSITHSIFEFLAFKNGIPIGSEKLKFKLLFQLLNRYPVLEKSALIGGPVSTFSVLQCIPIGDSIAVCVGQRHKYGDPD